MLIYKENISNDNLPPIKTEQIDNYTQNKINQNENTNDQPYKNTFTEINNYNNNLMTLEPNKISNNRYNIQDNNEIDNKDNNIIVNDEDNQKISKTIETPRSISNSSVLDTINNPYTAKVELQNVISIKDCIYLLEQYLKSQNKQPHYEISSGEDNMIFAFDDEKTAFDFTKIIYKEKIENSLFKNVLVHLSLSPNQNYIKKQRSEHKKRGISYETIMRLYSGSGYKKKVKEFPKVIGNIKFGIKSPFYNVNDSRKNKINSMRHLKGKNNSQSINNGGDFYGYVGYDGLPLKSYEKLKIRVLDTHYKPISNFNYRQEEKNKWVSPTNFKSY